MAVGGPIIGIDLGTTNSVVAVLEGGRPVIVPNLDGGRLTPSVVAFSDAGQVLVGELAKRQAATNPRQTIHSVKRLIGRRFREIRSAEKLLAFEVVGGRRGHAKIRVAGRDYSPQEISAHVLRRIKLDAEAYLSGPVARAVVTVPAYFNDAQRQATKDAGEIAGLVVERIINEPTAAALSYGLDRRDAATIAVLDLGGGTFDVTILRVDRGVFRILATSGDTRLGGDDFDRAILNEVADQFLSEHGIDPRGQPDSLQRLLEACERAKRELSVKDASDITLPFLVACDKGPCHLRREITRLEFEGLANSLFERCALPIVKALDDAGITPGDVQEIVLSGGGTRMPRFVELARQIFGREPRRGVNPEEAVAMGAAIQAGISSGDRRDLVLMDVTPFSMGIETTGGFMTRIIERNTTIPVRRTEVFSTSEDNQSIVILRVYQGEHELASRNRLLDEFNLEGVRPARRGEPRIEVAFDIDANGILHVGAEDLDTGRRQNVRISDSSGLSRGQIEHLRLQLEPSPAPGESGIADELRRYCESLCVELENALRRSTKVVDHDMVANLTRLIGDARQKLGRSSIAELKGTAADLAQAAADVARSERAAVHNHASGEPRRSCPNDDVIHVHLELS